MLPSPPPLRTQRASFTALRSSNAMLSLGFCRASNLVAVLLTGTIGVEHLQVLQLVWDPFLFGDFMVEVPLALWRDVLATHDALSFLI